MNSTNTRRREGSDPRRVINVIQGGYPIDMHTGWDSSIYDRGMMPKSPQPHYPNTSHGARNRNATASPQTHMVIGNIKQSVIEQNKKNYARNMMMLNEIRSKLPHEGMEPTTSPFEIESDYERMTRGQQMMIMNVKQYEMVALETNSVLDSIQKRAQTAQLGQNRPRQRVLALKKKRPIECEEPSISELYSQDGSMVKRDFWKSARSNSKPANGNFQSTTFDTHQLPIAAHKINMKQHNSRCEQQPLSAFEMTFPTSATNDANLYNPRPDSITKMPLRSPIAKTSSKPLSMLNNMHVQSIINPPVSTRNTNHQFKLLFAKLKGPSVEGDDETSRLYDGSKAIQGKIRVEQLRFLKSMQKELNQNYTMFEKPPRTNVSLDPDVRGSSQGSAYHEHESKFTIGQMTHPMSTERHNHLEDTQMSVQSPRSSRFHTSTVDSPEIGTPRSDNKEERPKSMQFATGNQMLLLVQDNLKQIIEKRREKHPQVDANNCMNEANFLMRTVMSSIKANGQIEDQVSHSLSLIWKYVVMTVDQCLQSQHNKFQYLVKKFDHEVELTVIEKMERFERDRLTFEHHRQSYEKQIEELEATVAKKDSERKKLQEVIVQHELKYESLRDPTGMQQFKRLITSFTTGLDSIMVEKEQQYTTMKAVVRIMDEYGEKRVCEESQLRIKHKKKKQKIQVMQDEMVTLRQQLELSKPLHLRKTKAQIEEEKLNKQLTVQNVLDKKKDKFCQFLDFQIPKEVLEIVEGTGLTTDELKAIRQIFINQFGVELERKLRQQFIDFYEKEVIKTKGLQLKLTQQKQDANGDVKIKPSDKFLDVMKDYFVQLVDNGMGGDTRTVGSNHLDSADSNGFHSEQMVDDGYYSEEEGADGSKRKRRRIAQTARNGQVGSFIDGDTQGNNGNRSDRKRKRGGGLDGESDYSVDSQGRRKKRSANSSDPYERGPDGKILIGADGKPVLRKGFKARGGKADWGDDFELDADGKPIIGADGFPVMRGGRDPFNIDEYELDADGKPILGPDGWPIRKRTNRGEYELGPDGKPLIGPDGRPIKRRGGGRRTGRAAWGDVFQLGPDGKPLIGADGFPIMRNGGRPFNPDDYELGPDGKPIIGADGWPVRRRGDDDSDESMSGDEAGGRSRRRRRRLVDGQGQIVRSRNNRGGAGDYQDGFKGLHDDDEDSRGEGSLDRSSAGGFGSMRGDGFKQMNLQNLDKIKSRINTGLAGADGSKNPRIIKQQLDIMKNPILSAIKKTLKLSAKKNKKMLKDFKIAMVPNKIFELMDNVMQEKVWIDIEQEADSIENRSAVPFHTFMYDVMIMKFGLQSIAIKTLIQMTNGLNYEMKQNPFAHSLSNMIGMAAPPYRLDEIQIVLRSHMFFKMVQESWITKTKRSHNFLEISKEDEQNLNRGGNCGIFELIDELKIAFKDDKEIQDRVITTIKPDCILKRSPNRNTLELRYSVLKITTKLSKLGKNPQWFFAQLDADKGGTLDCEEILAGLRNVIGVIFSKDETRELMNYMDEDKSGDIDEHEFCQRINLDNMHTEAHTFQISELTFIEHLLGEWYYFKKREQKTILDLIKTFDDNGDGVMQLIEYEAICTELEPGITKKVVLKLFKQAINMAEDAEDVDAIAPEVLMRQILQYKIGGYGKEFFGPYLSKRKIKWKEKQSKGGKK